MKKENKAIKDRTIRDIRSLFEHKGEDYYKPVRVGNFWSSNNIEQKSNGDRNKTLSVKEYLNKIRPYLKDIINNPKKSDTCKIQLTVAINFISSKANDEERVMYSKGDNIEIMINDKADEVKEKFFESLLSRHQIGSKTSLESTDFIFDCVHSLNYKCHKINSKRG